jgi:hypothetical protein
MPPPNYHYIPEATGWNTPLDESFFRTPEQNRTLSVPSSETTSTFPLHAHPGLAAASASVTAPSHDFYGRQGQDAGHLGTTYMSSPLDELAHLGGHFPNQLPPYPEQLPVLAPRGVPSGIRNTGGQCRTTSINSANWLAGRSNTGAMSVQPRRDAVDCKECGNLYKNKTSLR